MRRHKFLAGQRVAFAPGSPLSASVGGKLTVVCPLSVGVNGPEYRLHKAGESFHRVVPQDQLVLSP